MNSIYKGLKMPTYEFEAMGSLFKTINVPSATFKNKIAQIWAGYEIYPEMKEFSDKEKTEISNKEIINLLLSNGIINLILVKRVFDSKIQIVLIDENLETPEANLKRDKNKSIISNAFISLKEINPYVGIFQKEMDGMLLELDWLPIPVRNLVKSKTSKEIVRSLNIYQFENDSWLVSFLHEEDGFYLEQFLKIGQTEIFYDEQEQFFPGKIIELLEFLPNKKMIDITSAWDMFYTARYQYFLGEHPYSTKLDPVIPDEQDKIRMFLIWLNRLQEYILKLKILHNNGKTILLTGHHNEMTGKFVSYNTTYTQEIRNEIMEKKEKFQLYAIANDWYVNLLPNKI